MKEGALRWGLRILGISLAIGPILIVLGMHNFDIQAAFMPSEEDTAELTDSMSELVDVQGMGSLLTVGAYQPSGDGAIVEVTFNSPFEENVTVTDASGRVNTGFGVYQLRLEDDNVPIRGLESKDFNIIGETSTGGDLEPLSVTFEVYGVSIQAWMSMEGGGP